MHDRHSSFVVLATKIEASTSFSSHLETVTIVASAADDGDNTSNGNSSESYQQHGLLSTSYHHHHYHHHHHRTGSAHNNNNNTHSPHYHYTPNTTTPPPPPQQQHRRRPAHTRLRLTLSTSIDNQVEPSPSTSTFSLNIKKEELSTPSAFPSVRYSKQNNSDRPSRSNSGVKASQLTHRHLQNSDYNSSADVTPLKSSGPFLQPTFFHRRSYIFVNFVRDLVVLFNRFSLLLSLTVKNNAPTTSSGSCRSASADASTHPATAGSHGDNAGTVAGNHCSSSSKRLPDAKKADDLNCSSMSCSVAHASKPSDKSVKKAPKKHKYSTIRLVPLMLLFLQVAWILPYLLFANYLERSLLPFRLMCYIDPDLLSVQRSLRVQQDRCIRHFFTNREKPMNCVLRRKLNPLLVPAELLVRLDDRRRAGRSVGEQRDAAAADISAFDENWRHRHVRRKREELNSAQSSQAGDREPHSNRPHGRVPRRVLVVRSAPRHSTYRNYIRATWKRDVEPDMPVIFVSGRDDYDMRAESATYNDILQLDFIDSYQNLTMKMMGIYRFFLETTDVEQIAVINDDTIVNATGLRNVFDNKAITPSGLPADEPPQSYLIGKVSRGYPRLFFPWLPWYVPAHAYPHKCYPPFIQGSSFVISREAAAKILHHICDFPSIHLDDVMMGIVTNCLNIRNVHHEGFDRHLLNDFIVFHYQFSRYSAEKMYGLYHRIKTLL